MVQESINGIDTLSFPKIYSISETGEEETTSTIPWFPWTAVEIIAIRIKSPIEKIRQSSSTPPRERDILPSFQG